MSAAKPTTRSRPKGKPLAAGPADQTPASPPPEVPATEKPPRAAATVLRKKDLVERVAALSGAKKKTARDTVEAALALMGEALDRGEELNLPPFGKARITRSREVGGGTALILKLRRAGAGASGKAPGKDPLAEAED